jgi:hypothetical protein
MFMYFQIYEGTAQIQRVIISRELLTKAAHQIGILEDKSVLFFRWL